MRLATLCSVVPVRALHSLVAIALVAACAEDTHGVREVEDAIADVQSERRSFIAATQEEFVVAMEQELEDYKTILRGVEDRMVDGDASSERVAALDEGVADMAQRILEIKTTLDPSWVEQRDPLIQQANDLQRRLIAAWRDLR